MSATIQQHSRDHTIDMMRGIIMILMALDHSLAMVGKYSFGNEAWGLPLPEYSSIVQFLPRLISHLCAPGFIFLIGVGIVLLAQNRIEKGWTNNQIRSYLIKRGALLIVLQHFLYNPPWFILTKCSTFPSTPFPGTGGVPWFGFSVLSTLGFLLIIWAFLRTLKSRYIVLISILSFIVSQIIIVNAEPNNLYSPLLRLLFIPGQTGSWLVRYPLIPWLGLTGFGIVWGRNYIQNKANAYKTTFPIAITLLLMFIVIRFADSFGNFHSRGDSLLTFFHVTKYPPSLAYLSLTMGVNLCILWGLSLSKRSIGILQTIGASPLFFYITHIYLYLLMGFLFPSGTSFWLVILFWIMGIAILLPLCKKYQEFKRGKPGESFWRML